MAVNDVNNSAETVDRLFHLYQSGDLSDIELRVGNRRFQTHRLVLCMASDVLKTMLMSKFWPEGRSNRVVLREDPECVAVFEHFLQYLYTGKVVLNQFVVLPLLILADKYNVSHLSKSCLKYMCAHCCQDTIHHVISWLHYAIICGHKQLEDICNVFITNNFDNIIDIEEFLSISKEGLLKFLSCSDIVVSSEYKLYLAMKKWIYNAASEGELEKPLFHALVKHIRFPMMQLQSLLKLEADPLMSKHKTISLRHMFVCMKYHTGSKIDFPPKFLQALEMQKQFVPRIYPTEIWSTEIYVENVSTLFEGQVRGAFFSTPITHSDKDEFTHHDWNVMFYPKGVRYEPCLMIGVPQNLMNPGGMFKSVRLAFCTNCLKETRFKITVLVLGPSKDNKDYICKAISKYALFDSNCTRFNLEHVIPFEEIYKLNSPYKVHKDTLHLKIVIRPIYPVFGKK